VTECIGVSYNREIKTLSNGIMRKNINKEAILPYSQLQMFELVSDIESYPEYLPYCTDVSILSRDDNINQLEACVQVKKKGMIQSFTTCNTWDRPNKIVMSLKKGPFKSLEGTWSFIALTDTASKITFELEFELKAGFATSLIKWVVEPVSDQIVQAFCDKAHEIYGES
jgi:ribosome-associated toxin RatA of RatAB toxin-antitoxin module